MKRFLFTLMMVVVSLSAWAYDYPYLVFQTTDGTTYAVSVESLTLDVSNDQLIVTNDEGTQSFTLSELSKMYFSTEATVTTAQSEALYEGWTWFSSYLECTDDLMSQLENAISSVSNTAQIKSQTASITYSDGIWSGSLTDLENEKMYLLMTGGGDISLTGVAADPSDHPIAITNGWNWIGFVSKSEIALDDALASLTPINGDMIKGQSSYACFNDGSWFGHLTSMTPGQGYLYLTSGTTDTLIYPSASKNHVTSIYEDLHWNADYHAHPTNLTMMLTLDENVFAMSEGSHEIGAFVNGECRGSARLQSAEGKYIAFLTVSGEDDEEVSFRLFDVNTGAEYESATNGISYASNDIYGSIAHPMILQFGPADVDEMSSAESEEVEVFTIMGVSLGKRANANEAVKSLKPGIYLLKSKSNVTKTVVQ